MNEIRNTKYEIRSPWRSLVSTRRNTHDGFTLIEMVVAIGLLVIVVLFAGAIFKSGIGSYRMASAQSEIMQKLRVITQQLDSDFRGLRKDAPIFIWFQLDPSDLNKRLDQIMFFADGDFQSTRLYSGAPKKVPSTAGSPVISNVARIQYCHARVYSQTDRRFVDPSEQKYQNAFDRVYNIDHRTLARRQHLLTADADIISCPRPGSFPFVFVPQDNNDFEHDTLSLSQWQVITAVDVNVDRVIMTCFNLPTSGPSLNFQTGDGLYMLMAEGVASLSIQWSYFYTDVSTGKTFIYWWPSINPNGDGSISDSDFGPLGINLSSFGFYFNAANPSYANWFSNDDTGLMGQYYLTKPSYPQALKFTFTLYDSKGVFREGQTFTHIVYLGD